MLFNTCVKEVPIFTVSNSDTWYTINLKTLGGFIFKSVILTIVYTPHCLRATVITATSEAGFEKAAGPFQHPQYSGQSLLEELKVKKNHSLSVNYKRFSIHIFVL